MTGSRRRCAAVIFPVPAPATRSLTALTALARLSQRALRDHRSPQGQHPQPGLLGQHVPAAFPGPLAKVQGKLAVTRYPHLTPGLSGPGPGAVDGGQGYGVLMTAANGLVPRRGS